MKTYYSLESSTKFLNNQRYQPEITNAKIANDAVTDKLLVTFNVRIVDMTCKNPDKIFGFCAPLDELVTTPITDQVVDSLIVDNGKYELKAKYRKIAIKRLWKPIITNRHAYSTKDDEYVKDF